MAIPSTCLDDKCLGTSSEEKIIFPKTEISNLDLSDVRPSHQSSEQNLSKKPSMIMCRICHSCDLIQEYKNR